MKLAVERLQPLCLCLHFLNDWFELSRVCFFAVLLSGPVFALHAAVAREVVLGLLFLVQPCIQPSQELLRVCPRPLCSRFDGIAHLRCSVEHPHVLRSQAVVVCLPFLLGTWR